MTIQYKFTPRPFRDVTKQKPDVLKVVTADMSDDVITKIYECKETVIIHSKNSNSNHASISNAKGYDSIQQWEIKYAIDHILNEDYSNVSMLVSSNGVIHLYANKETVLLN
ncbi:hypothetical protein AMS59_12735 [Lysinibacillus sp. FJAT-14745]|uniref:hypothetical protein n=1 Tax=Lysinibacillus sp. FJAT-14745 TaxID=1704289 RepID=UPI0006ABE7A7|nr:hypothetical protein [Lysinibacillus sp. FJAT-14745]KOP78674.1 hypothetical protein AMS59_12735 [Lysinibacillus sp. FJAT-14745]